MLQKFHPDYKMDGFEILKMGPNKGEKAPTGSYAAFLQEEAVWTEKKYLYIP